MRIHALTARAVRESIADTQLAAIAKTSADPLVELCPNPDQLHAGLAATLRTNTDLLAEHSGDHLWHREGHRVLFRAGVSLLDAGLMTTASDYWRHMMDRSECLLGVDHLTTLAVRSNLATSLLAGRTA